MAYDFGPLTDKKLGVNQIFTNRLGGHSTGHYVSFNLGRGTKDLSASIDMNYLKLERELGLNNYSFIHTSQIHSNNIEIIDESFLEGKDRIINVKDCDGLVTNKTGVVLATFYADCTPVFFLDKDKKVIGVNHSGWRGTRNKISSDMINIFIKEYGSKLENILVYIGPNISKCCYEVSDDLYSEFSEFDRNEIFVKSMEKSGKYYLDMKKAIEITLLEKGVLKENINISEECTSCMNEKYYSYRRDNKITGRMSGIMWLEK